MRTVRGRIAVSPLPVRAPLRKRLRQWRALRRSMPCLCPLTQWPHGEIWTHALRSPTRSTVPGHCPQRLKPLQRRTTCACSCWVNQCNAALCCQSMRLIPIMATRCPISGAGCMTTRSAGRHWLRRGQNTPSGRHCLAGPTAHTEHHCSYILHNCPQTGRFLQRCAMSSPARRGPPHLSTANSAHCCILTSHRKAISKTR